MSKAFSNMKHDMKKLSFDLEKAASGTMLDITANSINEISQANPVDTGLSSGNWQGSITTMKPAFDSGELHPNRAGEVGLRSFYPTASRQRSDVIRKIKLRAHKTFVFNTISYVRDLNLKRGLWIDRNAEKAIMKTKFRKSKR